MLLEQGVCKALSFLVYPTITAKGERGFILTYGCDTAFLLV